MADIREKVAKLLALATSPNEQEAQAALLKARELMAKHKLRPEECQEGQDTRVIVQTIGVECTKMTDTWALALGGIIGKRYCCKVFRHHAHGAKKVEVGFAGLADDFEVCRKSTCMPISVSKTVVNVSRSRSGGGAAARRSGRCATPTAGASAMGWKLRSRNRSGSIRNGASFWLYPRLWMTP